MRTVLGLIGVAVLLAACGGASGPATALDVKLTDTTIVLSQASAPAGKVTFTVKNDGTTIHSLVFLRTTLDEAKLPEDPKDATKVDERGNVGKLGQLAAGETKSVTIDMPKGSYVIVCNEPAHYIVGMHVALAVK